MMPCLSEKNTQLRDLDFLSRTFAQLIIKEAIFFVSR